MDEAAHIIVAAELGNTAADANWLLPMMGAVKASLDELPPLGVADAYYRSWESFKNAPMPLLSREGKEQAEVNPHQYPHPAAMAARLKTDEGQQAYSKRKWIAEPPNGWIKNVMGFRQFSMRGLHRVRAEFKLVCMALNLRRMAVLAG